MSSYTVTSPNHTSAQKSGKGTRWQRHSIQAVRPSPAPSSCGISWATPRSSRHLLGYPKV